MTKAGKKLLEAVDEIVDWSKGNGTATFYIDGQKREMTVDEWFDHRERQRRAEALSELARNDAELIDTETADARAMIAATKGES